MVTPTYTQFPYFIPGTTGNTVTVTAAGTYSGILHSIVIAKALVGTLTVTDNASTIATFAIGTPAQSIIFDCSYSAPLKIATTASDFITVMAGPV